MSEATNTVFREVYEITGKPAIKIADAFFEKRREAHDAQLALVKELGATGYRPGYGGGIMTLIFTSADKVLPGMRRWQKGGRLECVPSGNTKAGRELKTRLAAAPIITPVERLAWEFGWPQGHMIFSEGKVHWPNAVQTRFPRVRYFLTVPRQLKDKWAPPAGLKLVRESDMLRAIEDHNEAVKDKKKAA